MVFMIYTYVVCRVMLVPWGVALWGVLDVGYRVWRGGMHTGFSDKCMSYDTRGVICMGVTVYGVGCTR